MLIKEAEDSRVYTCDLQKVTGLLAGIYEVARVEAPQRKPYILNTIQQYIRPVEPSPNLWPWVPNFPNLHPVFWEIRIDPIYSGQNRPDYLIGATSGIQGNPLPAWPRRDHMVEKLCVETASENRILVWGPCTIRFFATLTGVGTDAEFLQVGGRLAVFADYDDNSEFLRGDRYAIPKT